MPLENDLPYRALLLFFFSVPLTYWLYKVVRRKLSVASFFSVRENLFIGILFRLLQTVSTISTILYVMRPEYLSCAMIGLPPAVRLMGAVFGSCGGLLLFWTLRALGKYFSNTLTLREDHKLIISGPYGFVVHPMYDSFVLLWICYFLLSANWLIGASGLSAQFLIMAFRTPREERMMCERFGGEYAAYIAHTGRFLPRKSALFGGGAHEG